LRSPEPQQTSAGNPSAAVESLCKLLMPEWRGGAVWRREQTASQAGYLATVQGALSGNPWGRVLNQARALSRMQELEAGAERA
jgi:hypothetical protein